MDNKLIEIKDQISKVLNLSENKDWVRSEIIIQFPPAINKGYITLPSFWDADGNKVRIIPKFDSTINESLLDLILEANRDGKFNEILYEVFKDKDFESKIYLLYNKNIIDEFESYLPKSKRGKIKAWYDTSI